MKKKDIIRVGDRVKIINPEIFVRCGYSLTLWECTEIIGKEYEPLINEFIAKLPFCNEDPELHIYDRLSFKAQTEIIHALARVYIQYKKFGGKTRKVFTEHQEKYKNAIGYVDSIKFHKTGIYTPGRYNPIDGDDPPFLDKEKTHKILNLYRIKLASNPNPLPFEQASIETIHVEKMPKRELGEEE